MTSVILTSIIAFAEQFSSTRFFSGFRYLVGCFLKTPLSNYFSGTVLYGKHFWLKKWPFLKHKNNSFSPKRLVVFDNMETNSEKL